MASASGGQARRRRSTASLPSSGSPGWQCRTATRGPAAQLVRHERRRRRGQEGDHGGHLVGNGRGPGVVGSEDVGRALSPEEQRAAQHGADRVPLEGEGGDHAEVAATAAQRPEQLRVSVGTGPLDHPVGGDQLDLEQVVAGVAVLAGQPADASAERQPAHAGAGDQAARGRQAARAGDGVDLGPGAATARPDRRRWTRRPRRRSGRRGRGRSPCRRCRCRRRCGRRRAPPAAAGAREPAGWSAPRPRGSAAGR